MTLLTQKRACFQHRYYLVGPGVTLEMWDGESLAPELARLNDKGKAKQLKRLEGGDVGDEDELSEADRQWLHRMAKVALPWRRGGSV